VSARDEDVANGAGDGSGAEKSAEKSTEKPYFTVTRGNPGPVELGVLAAVFATAEGNAVSAGERSAGVRDDWGSYEDRLRTPFGYNPSSFLNARRY